jgi:hypothetical protein
MTGTAYAPADTANRPCRIGTESKLCQSGIPCADHIDSQGSLSLGDPSTVKGFFDGQLKFEIDTAS